MDAVKPAVAPAGPAAGRLLKRRAREMFRVYPKALVGNADAVHDLRVAARRLRSTLALLAEKPVGRRARRADRLLRDLARAAGRGRDLDVGLEILERSLHDVGDASTKLRRSLRAARSRAHVLAREALLDLEVAELRRDLRALSAGTRVDAAAFSTRHAALRRREEATIARELMAARDGRHPDALHGARRAARRLRYAAELAVAFQGAEPAEALRWKKTQTQLGRIQDRRVLADWLASRAARAETKGDAALAGAATRALARLKREAARMTREFFSAPMPRSDGPTPPPGPQA